MSPNPPLPESKVAYIVQQVRGWGEVDLSRRPHTDQGNGERLVDLFGRDLRFVPAWGWVHYDGARWTRDHSGEVGRMAVATMRVTFETAERLGDKSLQKHARSSESRAGLNNAIELASRDRRVIASPDQFDWYDWTLCVENGVLNLRTGELGEHRREDLITRLAPVTFDPDATCPRWNDFLLEIMGGNKGLASYLQRMAGYTITGSVRDHLFPFLYGTGRNGKGTFVGVLLQLLGDYGTSASSGLFLGGKDEADPRSGVAQLSGVRFAVATEVGEGRHLNEALVKKLTGADRLRGSFSYRDSFTFDPTHKCWMMGNHKPVVRGTDKGIWERIKLIPFTVDFSGRGDADLPEKLRAELSGILNWVLGGCREWQARGPAAPPEVHSATRAYRVEQDRLGPFIDSELVFELEAFTSTPDLKSTFTSWKEEVEEPDLSWEDVKRRLKEHCTPDRHTVGGKSTRGWVGVRLKTAAEQVAVFAEEVGGHA
jgi:putative DNA primase/helicase